MPENSSWIGYMPVTDIDIDIDMQKQTVRQTISAKAFIISAVDCVRLPENLDRTFRIMANHLIDRFLAQRAKQEQKPTTSEQ